MFVIFHSMEVEVEVVEAKLEIIEANVEIMVVMEVEVEVEEGAELAPGLIWP